MGGNESRDEPLASRVWYCLACGAENARSARLCRACGRTLGASSRQRHEGTSFLLNELEALRAEGEIGERTYRRLRRRYRAVLGLDAEAAPAAPPPAAPEVPPATPERAPPLTPPARPAAPRQEGPGWLAEQQANLLLYLGAFLIAIATLIFVGYSEQAIGDVARMALLIVGAVLFLVAGLVCRRIPRVRQAGLVFFGVGALMVPLNFAGAYAFFFAEEDADPNGLWLAGSLCSALFYGATSMLGLGRWYPIPMVIALLSGLGAVLALVDAPPEAYPASVIALAFVLAAPSLLPLGRVSKVFGFVGYWAAHAVVAPALIVALAMGVGPDTGEAGWLAASLSGALFYGAVSLLRPERWHPVPTVAALLSSLGAALALADAPPEAYPGSFIALAFVIAAPSLLPLGRVSEVFGFVGYWASQVVVAPAVLAALVMGVVAETGEGGWLAASLSGVLFYGIVSMLRLERWHGVPTVAALLSSLGAVLALVDAPPEACPGSFIALAFVIAAPSLLPLGRVSEAFGFVGYWAAHAVVAPALLVALAMTPFADGDGERALELATRWYLPPTALLSAFFYWIQALGARRARLGFEPVLTVVALAVTGAAALTLVYALDVGREWYGPAVAIVGWLYAAGSERFGPRWFGRRHLGWMALGAITVAWLCFEGIYVDFPRHGAGVHFAAAALYLGAARLVEMDVPLFQMATSKDQPEREPEFFRLPAAAVCIYAAGLTLGIGFYELLSSLPAAETAGASDLSLAFFWLSLGVAAVTATMRWWLPDMRLHAYAVTVGMSLFVLLGALDAEGQVALLLAVYTGVALALTLWEREPLALLLPAAYGFFALLAAWRHYQPDDAYLPLTFSAVGCGLFALYMVLRTRGESWSGVVQPLALGYAAVAPIAGWVRLSMLADDQGFVGTERFHETLLYQTSAASLFLLALVALAQASLARRLEVAVLASAALMAALLLEIGHFRPENVQAYTAPLGVYLLVGSMLASRVRGLSRDLRSLIGPLQALGASVLMGPSLAQSWQESGWPYALIVLVEGLVLLSLALVQRWSWLLATSTGFVVLDALRYLFDAARAMPNWVTVALAGLLLLAAGTAILLSREQWTRWQRLVRVWWNREALSADVAE